MACFLAPLTEAAVTKIIADKAEKSGKVSFARKLGWLTKLLAGGSTLLAFEHLWHGEVTPFFPFLTAMSNPADKAEMLHELSTAGIAMAILCTAVWCVMLAVCAMYEKKEAGAKA